MIQRINAEFVPVWIDVRTQAIPAAPGIERSLGTTQLDADRRIADTISRQFFVRNLVLEPDGTLLNPAPYDGAPFTMFLTRGHFPYAQVSSDNFLEMFDQALAERRRLRSSPAAAGAPL